MRSKIALLAATLVVMSIAIAASAAPENIAFILDASNSMNKPFDVGTRLEVAQDALIQLLDVVEAYSTAGVYIYGHRIPKDDVDASCQDIEALYPILPADAASNPSVAEAILALRAQGMTPIADALITVANDLTTYGGESVIILITDGEETCGGDPVMVAEMLRTLDPAVILHIVGLDVEASVRDALTEIAGITGGSYYGVGAAGDLFAALYTAVATEEEAVTAVDPLELFACYGVTNVIYGTEGDDVLYGTPGNDLIFGYAGDDFLMGLDGNDVLCGGAGNDILEGGNGNDILDGDDGNDLMFGGPDNDRICGGAGDDSIEGDAGDDALDGGAGFDTLLGGKGHDVLYCGDGADVLLEGLIVAGSSPFCPICETPCEPICPQPRDPCPKPDNACAPQPTSCAPICPQPAPSVTPCPPTDPKTLNEGETIQLHGTVSDRDCNVVEIYWEVSAGTLSDPTSLHPTYTAPMITGCENIDVQVKLTAIDSCQATGTDAFVLHVCNVNHAPTADAGPDLCLNEGDVHTLAACAADADNEGYQVHWSIIEGRGVIEDPNVVNAVYVAPYIDICTGERAVLQLRVVDPCGAEACDTVVIEIKDLNTAPTVDLGPAFTVDEGMMIRLTPVVSDPEGDALRYCWSTSGGTIDDPTAENPTLCVPMTQKCEGEDIVVRLTVTDPCGLTDTDDVCIHVANVNTAPTVNLGPDLCMQENGVITLTPTATDPEGDALTYTWKVSGGNLDTLCGATVVYCAPPTNVCEGESFVIQVTVTDPCGLCATDSIMVQVENINQAPIVHADP